LNAANPRGEIMRRSDMVAILFLLSGFVPVAAFAQQTTPDANQATPAQTGQTQQQAPDQPQTQNFQPGQTQQPSGQAQTQGTKEPSQSAQQPNQLRQQGPRSAQGTGTNQDQTAQQQAEERIKQAEERMIIDRIRQRLMEEREEQQAAGRNWGPGDEYMHPGPRYGSAAPGQGRDYQARPYPRVKTCIEYENGDEFCRYRPN
jgi:hypothetical protein